MQKAEAMHLCTDFQRSVAHRFLVSVKVFDVPHACRVTLHVGTSLLAQYDSFPEKLTFIQKSLLLLYIAKKIEN